MANGVSGYIDTLKVARKVFSKEKVTNYKQHTLVTEILGKQHSAHNAVEDVMSLQELFSKELQQHCGSEDIYSLKYHLIRSELKDLVNKKVISDVISTKLSRHGISLAHFKLAQSRDPNGARAILQEHKISTKLFLVLSRFSRWRTAALNCKYLWFTCIHAAWQLLIGELIGYPWSGVRHRHPSSVRPFMISNIFSSESAWPIKVKFYVEPPWQEGGWSLFNCSRSHDQDGRHAHIR